MCAGLESTLEQGNKSALTNPAFIKRGKGERPAFPRKKRKEKRGEIPVALNRGAKSPGNANGGEKGRNSERRREGEDDSLSPKRGGKVA